MRSGREYPARPLVGVAVVLLRPGQGGPEVLLIRRGRPPAEGEWSFPGGAQHLGETAEAAARRELMEETGLDVGTLQLAAHVDSIHCDPAGRVQFHYTILDFSGLWVGGAAQAGGDAAAVSWARTDRLAEAGLAAPARSIVTIAMRTLALKGDSPA